MIQTAKYWIEKLQLQKHPEGGWFKEVYRATDVVPESALPINFSGERNFSTSIYFLLNNEEFSAFHRIKSDELWHYYAGTSAVEILLIENGELKNVFIGNEIENNQHFQWVVPKNTWFAAHLVNKLGFALVGCTVSPGFHFEDFEMADEKLLVQFPDIGEKISSFIR